MKGLDWSLFDSWANLAGDGVVIEAPIDFVVKYAVPGEWKSVATIYDASATSYDAGASTESGGGYLFEHVDLTRIPWGGAMGIAAAVADILTSTRFLVFNEVLRFDVRWVGSEFRIMYALHPCRECDGRIVEDYGVLWLRPRGEGRTEVLATKHLKFDPNGGLRLLNRLIPTVVPTFLRQELERLRARSEFEYAHRNWRGPGSTPP